MILPGASITASPQITGTLFFFIRKPTPLFIRPATARERLITAAGSKLTVLGREPVVLGVLHVVEDLRRAQQRLGRDAAPVRADAAEEVALDDRGLEAELRGADRRHVAAGAGADDDDVEGGVGHRFSSNWPCLCPLWRQGSSGVRPPPAPAHQPPLDRDHDRDRNRDLGQDRQAGAAEHRVAPTQAPSAIAASGARARSARAGPIGDPVDRRDPAGHREAQCRARPSSAASSPASTSMATTSSRSALSATPI